MDLHLELVQVHDSLQDLKTSRMVPRTPHVAWPRSGNGTPSPQSVGPLSPCHVASMTLSLVLILQVLPPQAPPAVAVPQPLPPALPTLQPQPTVSFLDMAPRQKMPTINLPTLDRTDHVHEFLEWFQNFEVTNGLAGMQIIGLPFTHLKGSAAEW